MSEKISIRIIDIAPGLLEERSRRVLRSGQAYLVTIAYAKQLRLALDEAIACAEKLIAGRKER